MKSVSFFAPWHAADALELTREIDQINIALALPVYSTHLVEVEIHLP